MADKRVPAGRSNAWQYETVIRTAGARRVVPPTQIGDPDRDNILVVCNILPGGEKTGGKTFARIHATTNLADAIRQWRRRYGLFLPVSVYRVDSAVFCRAVGIPRLPAVVPIERAAQLFRRLPYSFPGGSPAFRHIGFVGSSAVPLLASWRRAVLAAREVDV